ncbi:nuclear transport factor 2 family protein [Amycolatopsis sp. NPDC051128]|uniref:nuclear transport factor 2 family protein n=1 Tax=Amycolatopsis sp. NPDC051128 TaxID=3155412 RepID=UPI0034254CF3
MAVGLEHVRLSYDYLNRGDTDGYASLLDTAVRLDQPGQEPIRGRRAAERLAAVRQLRGTGEHIVHDVFASGGRVAATGRFVGEYRGSAIEVDFADIFTLSNDGLLVEQKCYHYVDPA